MRDLKRGQAKIAVTEKNGQVTQKNKSTSSVTREAHPVSLMKILVLFSSSKCFNDASKHTVGS